MNELNWVKKLNETYKKNIILNTPNAYMPPSTEKTNDADIDMIKRISGGIKADSPEQHRHFSAYDFAVEAHEEWRRKFDPEGTGRAEMRQVYYGSIDPHRLRAAGFPSHVNINVPWHELDPSERRKHYERGLAAYDEMSSK